jgi:uncharacterized protein (DUF1800 family)
MRAAAWLLAFSLGVAGCAVPKPVPPVPADRPALPPPVAAPIPPAPAALPATSLSETQQILHVLDRLGYGPRPGDVEAVRRLGVAAWIESQLHPARLDDRDAERRLATLRVPAMTAAALVDAYPRPQTLRQRGMDMPREQSPQALIGELQRAKLLRAVYSERQLLEVMTDVWFNHFNVFSGKGAVRYQLPAYEREAIRPHALGRFRDLLGAVARHPAMLYYLDAWLSVVPGFQGRERTSGLNENYARELLELHTLGVEGGYTQTDIVEVARAFTGWSIGDPAPGHQVADGRHVFRPRAHDPGPKTILGHAFPPGGGREEGERVLDLLARHPSTARFVATKLARRFVADDPPAALVERAAAVFRESDGDIGAVVRAIVLSPEFLSPAAYRAKVKTPLEFVASALRALGAETDAGPPVQRTLLLMGQPSYGAQPPTGYSDRAESWANPGGLLARLNFAQGLAGGRLSGTSIDLGRVAPAAGEPTALADALIDGLLAGEASAETRAVIHDALAHPAIRRAILDDPVTAPDVAKVAALVLGSPEFQRR